MENLIKLIKKGVTWYCFPKIGRSVHYQEYRIMNLMEGDDGGRRNIVGNTETCLFSSDDAFIVRIYRIFIYIERERFSECLFAKRDQSFPLYRLILNIENMACNNLDLHN